ncbi:MAG: L-serine ammonia-lyase, iron-sulfur-dependent, subunit alpha [Erysipelotrichaceae bacterium]
MQSLRELFKIGPGPSSSHTIAPYRACLLSVDKFGLLDHYDIELYGSLSLTGKGHGTDQVIIDTFSPSRVEVKFKLDWEESFPNGFYLKGYNKNDDLVCDWTVFSLGGGSIDIKELELLDNNDIYYENSFNEIKRKLVNNSLWNYILDYEPNIEEHLMMCIDQMVKCVEVGLNSEGVLPGKLKLKRCAKELKNKALDDRTLLMAYAYAASEENAMGHQVVTTPTLGSCGIIAALVYYYYHDKQIDKSTLVKALGVCGLFGNVVKTNASISGAIGGCQAEIGTACAMGAVFSGYINNLNTCQLEYAAEIGIEHHLGLTCDPVGGYVMIPCIERNAVGVLRSMDAMNLSLLMSDIKSNKVSFDMVVNTMRFTGSKIATELKETSLGGLATEVEC